MTLLGNVPAAASSRFMHRMPHETLQAYLCTCNDTGSLWLAWHKGADKGQYCSTCCREHCGSRGL